MYPKVLHDAYSKPFRGTFADDFLAFLSQTDEDVRRGKRLVYAKALPVVQSSGTGKSRLLTEVSTFYNGRTFDRPCV